MLSSVVLLENCARLRKIAERFDDEKSLDDLDLAVTILDGMVSTIADAGVPVRVKAKEVEIRLSEAEKAIRRAFSRLEYLIEIEMEKQDP